MKLTLERIALAVLFVVVIILIMKDCSRPSEEREAERKEQYETQLAILQVEKATVQSMQDSLVRRHKEKVSADSSSLAIQDSKIKVLQTKLTNQRPKVIEKIQADSAVLSYVNTLEDVVGELQVQNDSLKAQKDFYRKVAEDLIAMENIEDKIEASMQIETTRRISELEQQGRKKERGKKGWKFLAVVGTIGGLFAGSQL